MLSLGANVFRGVTAKVQLPLRVSVTRSIVNEATMNSKDLLKARSSLVKEAFRKHPTDCGSTSVQIAIMTERIKNLSRHALAHKKDKASIRGFQMLTSKRRKLMKYLKKSDLDEFRRITEDLGILKEASHIK